MDEEVMGPKPPAAADGADPPPIAKRPRLQEAVHAVPRAGGAERRDVEGVPVKEPQEAELPPPEGEAEPPLATAGAPQNGSTHPPAGPPAPGAVPAAAPAAGLGLPEGSSPAAAGAAAAAALLDASEFPWAKERLPPPRENELEFLVRDPRSYRQGQSLLSPILTLQGSLRFRLLVFPMGTESTQRPEQLAAFVEVVPPEMAQDVRWAFEGVKYQISVVNWRDYRKTVTQNDTFTFQRDSADRGWHRGFLKASDMTQESGWLNKDGELCLRASCASRRAMLLLGGSVAGGGRKGTGYVGLKNHGATCYMNCLLQTLYHIGRFRHIVYSIECPESTGDQSGALSGDDAADGGGSGVDDRPAQPLLVALQNLFYRLQTSEAPVSCRELMRSFGWDTADAFMQHDAQELNRLLCDRLEEQMKGTAMDGAIKRLFEGEMENYIECMDIEYRSLRNETFYDLQLNVRNEAGRNLTSLEDSLRDFTSEEILEDDNAYDAGTHGKQRARKGCRFTRFPPVLYIQLKRFMFDAERMDMCKLNGRLEFPLRLDLEAMAPGSGHYLLHTVVVHSGGVSSGHYYAFVRVLPQGGDGEKSRWVKFDDEQVTLCSEQAAVEDNYGGEDPMLWNYFQLPPHQLHGRDAPTCPRIHNAYMLSYVRADHFEEILAQPLLDDEEQKYKRMVERCAREARLAEDRRRAKVEQLMRVEVRMLLERDLTKLEGFWSHHELPYSFRLRMSRDQLGEDLWHQAEELLDVPHTHIALFLLHLRKTRQTRFKFLPPNQALRQHLPAHGAPHSSALDAHLVVLCLVSRGYDPATLEWQAPVGSPEVPHDIFRWTDDICLLIVKYFCPTMQRLVTLGCYYCHQQEPIEVMLTQDSNWLHVRLQPFVDRKEVAPLPAGTPLMCWEEYCHRNPKVIERNIASTVEKEGLYNGDIIIWQPVPPAVQPQVGAAGVPPRDPQPLSNGVEDAPLPPVRAAENDAVAEAAAVAGGAGENGGHHVNGAHVSEEDADAPALTVKDLATRLANKIQVSVRLHSAEAPWSPEGVVADGVWGRTAAPTTGEDGSSDGVPPGDVATAASASLGELDARTVPADARWRLGTFMARAVQALGLEPAIESGRALWLFDRGPPASVDDPPAYRAEGGPGRASAAALAAAPGGERPLSDVLPRSTSSSTQRWELHLVLVPSAPGPAATASTSGAQAVPAKPPKPLALHFFDDAVREVGAAVVHLPDAGESEDELASDDTNPDAAGFTGRPSVDPAEVLDLARRHLELPSSSELLAKLLASRRSGSETIAGGPQEDGAAPGRQQERRERPRAPPLRLLEVLRGRINRVYRPSEAPPLPAGLPPHLSAAAADAAAGETAGGGLAPPAGGARQDAPRVRVKPWPSHGDNLFACALRVEPDWEGQEAAGPSGGGDAAAGAAAPGADGEALAPPRPLEQLVEVFHTEPSGREFGHPFLLRVAAGERAQAIAGRLQAKLGVSDPELRQWRLLLVDDEQRTAGPALRVPLDEADEWPVGRSCLPPAGARLAWTPTAPAFCVERPHPAHQSRSPTSTRVPRSQKPLTIRAR